MRKLVEKFRFGAFSKCIKISSEFIVDLAEWELCRERAY